MSGGLLAPVEICVIQVGTFPDSCSKWRAYGGDVTTRSIEEDGTSEGDLKHPVRSTHRRESRREAVGR